MEGIEEDAATVLQRSLKVSQRGADGAKGMGATRDPKQGMKSTSHTCSWSSSNY